MCFDFVFYTHLSLSIQKERKDQEREPQEVQLTAHSNFYFANSPELGIAKYS